MTKKIEKYSERSLEFINFRNIGINGNKEKIVLNHSLEKGKMGDLVVLVGPNNSGKSNVLDGIDEFANMGLTKSDINENDFDADINGNLPELTLAMKYNGNEAWINYKYNEKTRNYEFDLVKLDEPKVLNYWFDSVNEIVKDCDKFIAKESAKNPDINKYATYVNTLRNSLDDFESWMHDEKDFEVIWDGLLNVKNLLSMGMTTSETIYNFFNVKIINDRNSLNNEFEKLNEENRNILKESWNKQTSLELIPNVFRYDVKDEAKNGSLVCDYTEAPKLLLNLLNYLGKDFKSLNAIKERAKATAHPGLLENLENELNKKMKSVSDQFNKIYNANNFKYSFKLKILTDRFYLDIKNNGVSINLSNQSTGFKWFFNFFFNFLLGRELKRGDIILIDEAGSGIHRKGVVELRKFLKDYAIKNDVTIVAATQLDAMVDTDWLEELRNVYTDEKGECHIENRFSVTSSKNVLDDVLDALTIEQYAIMNPYCKLVFVEGITDYDYLTAFNNDRKKDLKFLPINGVKLNDSELDDLIKVLHKTRRGSLNFLVDGDKEGLKFKKRMQERGFDVISLDDINKEWTTIEKVFDENDLKNFDLEEKKYNNSYTFKKMFDAKYLNKKSIKNFNELLEFIDKNIDY